MTKPEHKKAEFGEPDSLVHVTVSQRIGKTPTIFVNFFDGHIEIKDAEMRLRVLQAAVKLASEWAKEEGKAARSSTCHASEDDKGFKSFMYTPAVAALFGLRQDQVFPVKIRELYDGETSEYWAWWSTEQQLFVPGMIWPSQDLVEMCFPYGTEIEVKKGRGELVNVLVEKVATP